MKAGELNRRISIQRASFTTNALNEKVRQWNTIATVWASKKDVRDSERFQGSEVQAAITTRFQIRHESIVADIDPRDRLIFEGRTYEIFAVKEIGRGDGLEITAGGRVEGAEHIAEVEAGAVGAAAGVSETIAAGAGSASGSGD